jgi:hypothetical protein
MRALSSLCWSCSLLLALAMGCPQAPTEGSFGDAKPVKNDGTVRKPEVVDAPPNFDDALQVVAAMQGDALRVTLKLKPGYHAYAPGNEIGKPVGLSVDGVSCTMQGPAVIPAGAKKDLGPLGQAVILEGDVVLAATVTSTAGCAGIVEAQVCTDKACDRPRKHPFKV